jgi:hypothetical protein
VSLFGPPYSFLLNRVSAFWNKIRLWTWDPNWSSKHRHSWVSLGPPPPTWPGRQAICSNYFISIFIPYQVPRVEGGLPQKGGGGGGFSGLNTRPYVPTSSHKPTRSPVHFAQDNHFWPFWRDIISKNPKRIHSNGTDTKFMRNHRNICLRRLLKFFKIVKSLLAALLVLVVAQ